jgi:hypothetical protein
MKKLFFAVILGSFIMSYSPGYAQDSTKTKEKEAKMIKKEEKGKHKKAMKKEEKMEKKDDKAK